MGYSKTLEFGDNFNFPCSPDQFINKTLTTVVTDRTLPSITLPAFTSGIKHAYLHINIGRIYNTNVGVENYFDPDSSFTYAQVRIAGGAWADALLIYIRSMTCPTDGVYPGVSLMGRIDVASSFASGTKTDVQIHNGASNSDTLILYDVYPSVSLIME